MVANICIERQILAYHKNLLNVTCLFKCQLILHASPTPQIKLTKRKKDQSISTWEVKKSLSTLGKK